MGGVKQNIELDLILRQKQWGYFVDVAVSDISKQVYLETGGGRDLLAHSFRELYILLQNKPSYKGEHCGSSSLHLLCYHNVILFKQFNVLTSFMAQ